MTEQVKMEKRERIFAWGGGLGAGGGEEEAERRELGAAG